MLFFRSEEHAAAWCREREQPLRPLVTMAQLWGMATAWYANRLEPDAKRPGPGEIRGIFAGLGLREPFWDPQSDEF
jgi:hypothetical protein